MQPTTRSGRTKVAAALALIVVILLSATPATAPAQADEWEPGMTWQIKLSNPPSQTEIDNAGQFQAYDLDLFETKASEIAEIKAHGTLVICYFSAGTYEEWRPDKKQFPKRAIGKELGDWPGEYYVDIRNQKIRAIMRQRLQLAANKGCDAVDPDNVDAFQNKSGFKLKAKHQLSFNRFLAQEAHALGLEIGLKNDIDQIPQLVNDFDFAVNEQCFRYTECGKLLPFIDAGKPVFSIEYGQNLGTVADRVCAAANDKQFSTLAKKLSLNGEYRACWNWPA